MIIKENVFDGEIGYGEGANIFHLEILESLPENKRKEHEAKLEKENPIKYAEFKEWVEDVKSYDKLISDEELDLD